MLAAHAESSINGLGYWLVPGNNWGNCLLLGVNGQGRLMHCTVLWGRLYCVVHTLTGEWGVIRPRQTSIHRALWRAMSRTLLYKEAAWGWSPVTSAMITHVPLHYWWLHTCPFITDANHSIIILNPKTSRTHCTEYRANEVNVLSPPSHTGLFALML